ncbi:hypothetical protein bcgnr5373_59080 [Bacillus cereus]
MKRGHDDIGIGLFLIKFLKKVIIMEEVLHIKNVSKVYEGKDLYKLSEEENFCS